MTRMIRTFLLGLATVALAAACTAQAAAPSVASLEDPAASGDPNASVSPSAPTNPQDAFLAFAQCMRDHGIDMPDPEVTDEGGGKFSVGFNGGGPDGGADQEKFKEANEACQPLLENAIGEDSRPELTPEQEQAMLDFARCMREHGIDMPDPGENGMVFNIGGPGQDGEFDQKAFEAAQEACQDMLPGRLGGDGPSLQVGPGGGANGESGPSVKTNEESN